MILKTVNASIDCTKHGAQISRYGAICPLCKEEQRAESETREKKERIDRSVARACVAPEYSSLSLDQLKPTVREWLSRMPGPEQLMILGIPGCGKTTQASTAILELARRELFATFRDCGAVIGSMVAAQRHKGDASYTATLQGYITPHVLLLDDYAEFPEWQAQQLRAVVEARTAARRSTIITTNLTADKFTAQNLSSAQIFSRMLRMGFIIEILDPSYRRPLKVSRE